MIKMKMLRIRRIREMRRKKGTIRSRERPKKKMQVYQIKRTSLLCQR